MLNFGWKKITCAIGVIGLFAPIVGEAFAEPTAGRAIEVRPSTSVSSREGNAILQVGMKVVAGDRIKTDRSGQAQLLFTDGTKLVVGPNSSLVIEAYLLRSNNRVNNFTVRALSGSFRMITGKSDKKAYKIKTPTATIGVRGTSFDFTVQPNGVTGVMLFEGEARICGRNGKCQNLNRRCSVAQARRNSDVRLLNDAKNRNIRIKRDFPLAASQQSLRRDFRVKARGCGKTAILVDPVERTKMRQAQSPKPKPGRLTESGNPGNGGPMGNAGADPGNNDFGSPDRGRSDTAPGRGRSGRQ